MAMWCCRRRLLVAGYQSDVTRTGIFGKAPEKVARVLRKSSAKRRMPLSDARGWTATGTVDDGARKVVTTGTDDYNIHDRLGHGIGLDGHEHPYLVRKQDGA